jgi:hypothetical protein
MCLTFKDLILVAQSATCENTQSTAVDFATLFTQGILAVRKHKKLDLHSFLAAGKSGGSSLSISATQSLLYTSFSVAPFSFTTDFQCC